MFTLVVLLVSCAVVSDAQLDNPIYQPTEVKYPECNEPNEVLNHCVGCPPEDSCYDRNQISCLAAFLGCRPACVCKEGYIRKTLSSECIPKEECGAPCEIFTQYSDCKQCANDTCSSITNPSKSNCNSEVTCTPGCACWPGYYKKDETSPCQHRCTCPELEDSEECEFWRTPIGTERPLKTKMFNH